MVQELNLWESFYFQFMNTTEEITRKRELETKKKLSDEEAVEYFNLLSAEDHEAEQLSDVASDDEENVNQLVENIGLNMEIEDDNEELMDLDEADSDEEDLLNVAGSNQVDWIARSGA